MANVPGAIYRVALDDGLSLRLIGDEIERISGHPAEEFVDGAVRTLFDIVHPDDRTRVEVGSAPRSPSGGRWTCSTGSSAPTAACAGCSSARRSAATGSTA